MLKTTHYRIKNILMRADSVIQEEDADYLADCLCKETYFDFSWEDTCGLSIMCLAIGILIGTLCR